MMKRPANWDEVEASTGEFKRLTAGGHACVILNAEVTRSKSGKEMLVLDFDIDDGDEFAGYFSEQYGRYSENGNAAKWPNDGTYRQLTEGKSMGFFKGMLQNIEASNEGWKWNWNEKELVGKKFGGVFREEAYINNKGDKRTRVTCIAVRPVQGIENVTVPTPKDTTGSQPSGGFGSVADEIPF